MNHNLDLVVQNPFADEGAPADEGVRRLPSANSYDEAEIDQNRARCLMSLWRSRSLKAARAHYKESLSYRNLNRGLTLVNASLSIGILFVSNAVWVRDSIGAGASGSGARSEIVISLIAVGIVVTTIMQYILRFGEKANEHKAAGSEFANLQRRIERYLLATQVTMSMVHNVSRIYNQISKSSRLIPQKKWHNAGKGKINENIDKLETIFEEHPLAVLTEPHMNE